MTFHQWRLYENTAGILQPDTRLTESGIFIVNVCVKLCVRSRGMLCHMSHVINVSKSFSLRKAQCEIMMFLLHLDPVFYMAMMIDLMRKTCFPPKTWLSKADWKQTLLGSYDQILSGSVIVMGAAPSSFVW